jgi:peroxiredoxin Q/BCP
MSIPSRFRALMLGALLLLTSVFSTTDFAQSAQPSRQAKKIQKQFKQDGKQLLPIGYPAPAFNLPATTGKNIQLTDYRGKKLVVIFYPMDQTPGCTIQLCALRDLYGEIKTLGAEGIASNPASVESHRKFAAKQHYQFPLLEDKNKTMAHDYGVIGHLGMINRTVYIVDSKGIIRFAERGMPSTQDLLQALKKIH